MGRRLPYMTPGLRPTDTFVVITHPRVDVGSGHTGDTDGPGPVQGHTGRSETH